VAGRHTVPYRISYQVRDRGKEVRTAALPLTVMTGPTLQRGTERLAGKKMVRRCTGRINPKKAGEVLGWAQQHSDLAAIITDAWRWHNERFGSKGL
jgi:alpha-D-ribose 1-methylphosphonate 5-triphosphate synthase subunit PhnG